MAGLVGLILVSVNVSIGIGQYLALCEDQMEAPPLTYISSSTWQNNTMHIAWSVTNLNTTMTYSIYLVDVTKWIIGIRRRWLVQLE